MANKIFVSPKQSADGTVIGFVALIAIDNGDGTYSLFIKDQATSGAPAIAAAISSSGASPVIAAAGTGSVSGTGTTGKAVKWSNGAGSVITDADLAAIVASLGFTPEDVANKTTDGTLAANSDTLYPSEKAVKTYADTKQPALGFTPENVANKSTSIALGESDVLYPSQRATKHYVDQLVVTYAQPVLGFTPENVINKTTDGTLAANSDTLYPSEKAVKTYVDAHATPAQTAPWFMPNPNFASGGVLSSLGTFLGVNEVQVWMFNVPFQITINRLTFEVVTPDVGNFVGMAIYNAAGTTKLADTGAVAATAGIKSIALGAPVVLAPGAYWLAWTHNNNVVSVRGLGNVPNFNAFFNDDTVKVGTAANAGVAGVCPATLGVVTAQTGIGQILAKFET